MTNYEAIKAMEQHELAGFLVSITTCGDCPAFDDCDGHGVCTEAMLEWLTDESDDLAKGGNEMENRTILFQGKEIDVDDEPGETSDMIHHPDHYTWKGTAWSIWSGSLLHGEHHQVPLPLPKEGDAGD